MIMRGSRVMFPDETGKLTSVYYDSLSTKNKLKCLEYHYIGPRAKIENELAIAEGEREYIKMGKDFEQMLQQVKENELTAAAWKAFMMTLRLVH